MSVRICKGPNCTRTDTNGHKHSSECRFEYARNLASGIKSVEYGVDVPDSAVLINWRGRTIDLRLLPAAFAGGGKVEWLDDVGKWHRAEILSANPETYDARLDDGQDAFGYEADRFREAQPTSHGAGVSE